jgi:two-component system, chemotaxis family, sensor kinase CheA
MDPLAELRPIFFQECEELLATAEDNLMALDQGNRDPETLNSLFRAIHSIKGGAGAFGFDRMVGFAHVFESLLDLLRSGKLEPTTEIVKLLLRARDMIADIVSAAQNNTDLPPGHEAEIATQLAATANVAVPTSVSASAARATETLFAAPSAEPAVPIPTMHRYRISFVPKPDLFRRANEPLFLLQELNRIGMLTAVADLAAIPMLADLDPESAYLRWTLELETDQKIGQIREVFDFVVDDAHLHIEVEGSPAIAAAPVTQASLPTAPVPQPAVATQKAAATEAAAPRTPKSSDTGSKEKPGVANRSVRVDIEKLDRVVNTVGELVISQAMLFEQLAMLAPEQFNMMVNGIEEMSQHVRDLQDGVMAMRAQPVQSVFSRMPRLVRDVADKTGKKVRLVITGEETEIDKTVIEQLNEPLTHMIRNSVDHGIELPDERIAGGKPEEGIIRLSAGHMGGRIVIQIADDGRGINRTKVLDKAVRNGLIAPDANLTDVQIDELIFAPGLSTADALSEVSGRGVGMDVVRSNIQRLGGQVSIKSQPGLGSTFSLALPLTLAVLDGMLVRIGNETFVLPLTNVTASLRPTAKDIRKVPGRPDLLLVRGAYIPILYLHEHFTVRNAVTDPTQALIMLVEVPSLGRLALLVDEIVGEQQVVIKSLEDNYRAIPGISAATILGNGRVAFIIDVPGIFQIALGEPLTSDAALHNDKAA